MLSMDTVITIGGGIAFIGSMCLNLYQQSRLSRYSRFGEFLKVWAECGGKKPMGLIADKSSKLIPFVCEPSEKNPAMLTGPQSKTSKGAKSKYTLLTPQAAQASNLMELPGGQKICLFQLPWHFPFNIQSAAALCELGQAIEIHPRLKYFRNSLKIIELSFDKSGSFETNCRNYIRTAVKYNLEHGDVITIPYTPQEA